MQQATKSGNKQFCLVLQNRRSLIAQQHNDMKRNKDEDKDDGIVSGTIAGPGIVNNNNSAKISNNAASNTGSNSSDANSGSGTAGTVRTTGRVKVSCNNKNNDSKYM